MCECVLVSNRYDKQKRKLRRSGLYWLWLPIIAACLAVFHGTPAVAQDEQEHRGSDLPKVLLIGDSISIGYTPFVKEQLMTKADVTHHPGNAQHTGTGLKKLDDWLGDEEWDVIHFNWGLWDLCYRHPDAKTTGKRDKVRGTLTTPIEQYEEQLERIVERLKKTDAKLVWASTTPVPENEPGRFAGDAEKYNRVAAQIMQKHEIIINDLHRFAATRLDEIQKPSDVHFTEEGSRSLASQVSKVILQQLETGCSASVTEEKRR